MSSGLDGIAGSLLPHVIAYHIVTKWCELVVVVVVVVRLKSGRTVRMVIAPGTSNYSFGLTIDRNQ